MSKKVKIGIGVGVGVLIVALATVGFFGGCFTGEEPVNNDGDVINLPDEEGNDIFLEDEPYVGEPLPNIINKAGTIKKVKKNSVVINGPEDEDIIIYINKNTNIYGPDGNERKIDDLEVGMYITVDIDGDEREADEPEDEFDAITIYISGK